MPLASPLPRLPWGRPALTAVLTAGLFVATLWNLRFFLHPSKVSKHREPLVVLVWEWPSKQVPNISGDVCRELYGIAGCRLTTQRWLLARADVVVFPHTRLQAGRGTLPRERPPGQNWVWVSLESPSNTKGLAGWNQTFNWVMTYRQDSDIFIPYGKLVPSPSATVNIPTKTSLVSWVISNYHRTQKRAKVYKNLSKYLPVNIYGKANKKPLCKDCLLPTTSQSKFYLAFENSIHRDYITEKLWRNALMAGTVPVVLGPPRANYEKFIPADSFIHVDDFGSLAELATFLKSMNSSRYQQFFAWQQRFRVKLYADWRERCWRERSCPICPASPSLSRGHLYPDLESWFNT
ncbi:PREDICTED: LOW QUALITY PROTEIN: alpha-(1,3)-fucosyltransferase 7 [Merops nubicus]|uniref:LOW QUALITY PROTEIN: alpha-(1,3)-fucosyltransferase 7 n=1 Tax=Merops nubicus TaxID=57421 RepID=UPI0004F0C139|nr:PREDICTED: LOW QUALITY PROTEIN: alpha-(1,3)-fucosyltransferase 7 [Merops nubicus]